MINKHCFGTQYIVSVPTDVMYRILCNAEMPNKQADTACHNDLL